MDLKKKCGGHNMFYPYGQEQKFGFGGMGWLAGVDSEKPWLA